MFSGLFPPRQALPTPSLAEQSRRAAEELIRQAEAEERAANPSSALPLYERGVQSLLEAIKRETDDALKRSMRARAAECLSRAEALKQRRAPPPQHAGVIPLPPRTHKPLAPLPPRTTPPPAPPPAPPAQAAGRGRGAADAALSSQLDSSIVSEKPNVRWDDVAGLETAKATLQEAVVLPLRFPNLFTGERRPWRGILLYGPPGTGKSHLAKAVASEVDATFFAISSSDLVSKWVGESEKLVRALFEAASARRPAIIFIDEIDALATTRTDSESDSSRRLKNELLVRMSDAPEGVLVLAATNMPWALDPAVRRRFEKRVYIPLPDANARLALLKIHLGATPHRLSEGMCRTIAQRTEGFSGADMSVLVRDALMEPVRHLQQATHFRQGANGLWEACGPRDRGAQKISLMQVPAQALATPEVRDEHFARVLQRARPSVGKEDQSKYEEFTREFGTG
ncbi:hypothetical protein AB1Y20_023215 [Prymnesium parvum]|uniref:Vesicle-fusing ATPase n=1 Tax=Prymnesium parvum TaxID=97485 RepID=A0AB34JCH6_PRYPA